MEGRGREHFCVALLPPKPPCSALVSSSWGIRLKILGGGKESVWLECKVATALQANVHAVRCCHSDQSLSTSSSPPTPSCSHSIISDSLNSQLTKYYIHVESPIMMRTLPNTSWVSPSWVPGRTSGREEPGKQLDPKILSRHYLIVNSFRMSPLLQIWTSGRFIP